MPNARFSKFPSKGPPTGQEGKKHDSVMPIKTKNWPGVPGKTQPANRAQGINRLKPAAASEGI